MRLTNNRVLYIHIRLSVEQLGFSPRWCLLNTAPSPLLILEYATGACRYKSHIISIIVKCVEAWLFLYIIMVKKNTFNFRKSSGSKEMSRHWKRPPPLIAQLPTDCYRTDMVRLDVTNLLCFAAKIVYNYVIDQLCWSAVSHEQAHSIPVENQ